MGDATNWFRHDVNAMGDKSLQGVIRRFGMEGVGIYWCLVETLYKEGGFLSLSDLEDLAFSFHVTVQQVENVVRDSGLFKFDSQYFWSSRVLSELQRVEDISKIKTKASRVRWEKTGGQQPDNEKPLSDTSNACALHGDETCNADDNACAMQGDDGCNAVTNVTNVTNVTENTKREEELQPRAEGPAPGRPVVVSLPMLSGKEFPIYQDQIDQFVKAYPALDVPLQIERMKAWLMANPKNGKTNITRFMNNWLTKQQDRGGTSARGMPTERPSQREIGSEARWNDYLEGIKPKEAL